MRIPKFEDPINNEHDLVDRNITIFEYDWLFHSTKDYYYDLGTTKWKDVANTMVSAKGCWNETNICTEEPGSWQNMVKYWLHGNKTHAIIGNNLWETDLEIMVKENWWRSDKLEDGSNPYGALPTSRNWILNEVITLLYTDNI